MSMAVGSMPHRDPADACRVVLKHTPALPAWPQLPNRSTRELMHLQAAEGLPGVLLRGGRISVDAADALSHKVENSSGCPMSPESASGLHAFLSTDIGNPIAVKGQLIGPVSFCLAVKDQDSEPLLFNERLSLMVAEHLRLKALWQENALAKLCPRTVFFLDEPGLGILERSHVAPDDFAIQLIEHTLSGVNGIKGIHCCSSDGLELLLRTSVEIIGVDVYNHVNLFAGYSQEVESFLARGGILAWGVVPTKESALAAETVDNLANRLDQAVRRLADWGVSEERLRKQWMFTTSCGLASLRPEGAEQALKLAAELSRKLGTGQSVRALAPS